MARVAKPLARCVAQRGRRRGLSLWRAAGIAVLAGACQQHERPPRDPWTVEALTEWPRGVVAEVSLRQSNRLGLRLPTRYVVLDAHSEPEPLLGPGGTAVVALDGVGRCFMECPGGGCTVTRPADTDATVDFPHRCELHASVACRSDRTIVACDGRLYVEQNRIWRLAREGPGYATMVHTASGVLVHYQAASSSLFAYASSLLHVPDGGEPTPLLLPGPALGDDRRNRFQLPLKALAAQGDRVWLARRTDFYPSPQDPGVLHSFRLQAPHAAIAERTDALDVEAIQTEADKIWIAGRDPGRRSWRLMSSADLDASAGQRVWHDLPLGSLAHHQITAIYPQSPLGIWLGTYSSGVALYDPALRSPRVWRSLVNGATEHLFPPELTGAANASNDRATARASVAYRSPLPSASNGTLAARRSWSALPSVRY